MASTQTTETGVVMSDDVMALLLIAGIRYAYDNRGNAASVDLASGLVDIVPSLPEGVRGVVAAEAQSRANMWGLLSGDAGDSLWDGRDKEMWANLTARIVEAANPAA